MWRAILGVFLGYVAMVVVVMLSFTALQLGLGTEKVFKPGSYEASTLFILLAVVISLVAAVAGGFVCAAVAKRDRPVMVLAGIILALGVLSAVMNMNKPAPEPRTGDISPLQAAQNARQPSWYSWCLPVIGAAGCMIGARLRRPPTPGK